jgi:hypothetical protein
MSLPPPVPRTTAKTVLFGTDQPDDTVLKGEEAKAADAAAGAAMGKLSKVARKVAERQVRKAILDLLDIDLLGVVQRGWARHDALIAAAQRTAAGGGREVVALADHTVSSTHTPHVKVSVDGVELGTINIAVLMSLKLIGITGVVEGGQLVAVETGSVAATAKLSVEDVPITTRSQTLDAVFALRLAKPMPLIAPSTPLAPPSPGTKSSDNR